MATIDLGKIKLVWRGTYAGGTAYTVDDVVQHTDNGVTSSFICTTNSTGNAPSTGGSVHSSWAYLAKGGAAGTDVSTTLTTQGDILYRDGSGLQRLAKGTAGQALKMNSSANAPEWGTVAGGILQFQTTHYASAQSTTSQTESATSLTVAITPASTSNKIWVEGHVGGTRQDGNGSLYLKIYRKIGSGSFSVWRTMGDGWYLYASQTTGHAGFSFVDTTHNTTSQIDYKLYFRSENGTTVGFNMGGSSSTINAIELGV